MTHPHTSRILIVAGLGRCGSTMMMRMLHAGGVDVVADNLDSYETESTLGLPRDSGWLNMCAGKAVKVIDPNRYRLPRRLSYAVIFMRRDPAEQAKSKAKELKGTIRVTPSMLSALRQYIPAAYRQAIRECNLRNTSGDALEVQFERVLDNPKHEAWRVKGWLARAGFVVDAERMAAEVIPRGPECSDGLLELGFMGRGAPGKEAQ